MLIIDMQIGSANAMHLQLWSQVLLQKERFGTCCIWVIQLCSLIHLLKIQSSLVKCLIFIVPKSALLTEDVDINIHHNRS